MKTLVIREFGNDKIDSVYELDLTKIDPKDCTGCWSCWLNTPGKCINRDMDEFYRKYLEAGRVVIFSKVTRGFISGRLKTVIDRMIPLYLPYVEVTDGGCNHEPRYAKYPDIEFYYSGCFNSDDGEKVFKDYIRRTFTQYRSKNITISEMKYQEDLI